MPFGRDDRALLRQISNQLSQVTADLAVVKQQVADQQHTVSQFRQDSTTSVLRAGLAEIRTATGEELASLRGAIDRLDGRLRAMVSPAASESVPQVAGEGSDDLATLQAAAGISAAKLYAHRDTWEFLVKHAGADQHFHVPGTVDEDDGIVVAQLSGPSLVAVLTSLADVRDDMAAGPGTRAIAHHLYDRVRGIVDRIAQDPWTGGDGHPVIIRVDDRPKPDDGGGRR
ncbi:hypothetical protein ACFY78_00125 [Streptomyces olindensis]|uniref:hypothetical protein n=1 Tax=Streptomyces olindensis TaxID=358823 RepID=UPI00369CDA37